MNVPLVIAVPVVATAALAVVADVRARRIPNLLTGTALLAGVAVHLASRGGPGLGEAGLGILVAGGILLPGWLIGGMGAGDVKLVAAIGAWLGPAHGLFAALASLIAGGLLALFVAWRHGVLSGSLRRAVMLGAWVTQPGSGSAPPVTTGLRFPFAPAVLIGSVAALWMNT